MLGRSGVALSRRKPQPHVGEGEVPRHALSARVHGAQVVLTKGEALHGRFAIPLQGLLTLWATP